MLELVRLAGLERAEAAPALGRPAAAGGARARARDAPRVLLLDEPLGALDLKVRKELQIELKRIQEEIGITFVYVTHDQEEALAMSDRVVGDERRPDRAARSCRTRSTTSRRPSAIAGFIGDTNFIRLDGKEIAVRPERLRVVAEAATGFAAAWSRRRWSSAGGAMPRPTRQTARRCWSGSNGQEQVGGIEALAEGERVSVTWADEEALDSIKEGTNERRASLFWEQPVSRRGFMAGATAAALAAAGLGRFGSDAFAAGEAADAGGTLNYYNWART